MYDFPSYANNKELTSIPHNTVQTLHGIIELASINSSYYKFVTVLPMLTHYIPILERSLVGVDN